MAFLTSLAEQIDVHLGRHAGVTQFSQLVTFHLRKWSSRSGGDWKNGEVTDTAGMIFRRFSSVSEARRVDQTQKLRWIRLQTDRPHKLRMVIKSWSPACR